MSSLDNVTQHRGIAHNSYRPDIDGLRAIAILSVVIFHAFPASLKGGFVGVDIFFVISGFLISTIIFRGVESGNFSFVEFYANRIKRIFPALIVVLMASYAFGWFVLLPDEFKQLSKHIAGGAGFVQNFVLRDEAGYFDISAEFKPLLHLWSLAIEEQFYLVYPIVIFVAWWMGLNVFSVILVLGLISFGLNIARIEANPIKTFFYPQTRFWELLAGAVLAYIQFFKKAEFSAAMLHWIFHPILFRKPPQSEQQKEVLDNILSVSGLLLIAASVCLIDKSKLYPGWWALLPVSGATLLILAGQEALVNRVILGNKYMVFVGLISYPLYLWHWPVISFALIVEGETPPLEIRIGAVILSVALAWLTYRLVERPVRFGEKTWIKTATPAFVLLAVGVVGYTTFQRNGFDHRAREFLAISTAAGEWEYPGNLVSAKHKETFDYFIQRSKRDAITLFVGDSNIEQYFPRVESLITSSPEETNGIIFKTGGGCLAIPGQLQGAKHQHCSVLMRDAMILVKEVPEIDTIVIGSQWNGYLGEGRMMTKDYGVGSPEYNDALKKLGGYIQELRALNKRVFVVLNIPVGRELDPKNMVVRDLSSFPRVLSIHTGSIQRQDLESAYGEIQSDLARVAVDAGAVVIKPMDFLCNHECPSVDIYGEPIYKDAFHLRPKYVRSNANFIDVTVKHGVRSTVRSTKE